MTIDEISVRSFVRQNIRTLCERYYPGGKLGTDGEWHCADVHGNPGNSFAIALEGEKAGLCNDHAEGYGGDFIGALGLKLGLKFPGVVDELERTFALSFHAGNSTNKRTPRPNFDWNVYRRLTESDQKRLAEWRSYSPEFVDWLVAQDGIRTGIGWNNAPTWGFPIWLDGKIAGAH